MIYTCYSTGDDLVTYDRQKEVARELLNYGLIHDFGIREEKIVKSPLGKPRFEIETSLKVSISHCRGAVAVMISDYDVGIDVERVRSYEREAARRILTKEEWKDLLEITEEPAEMFFKYFTLKESYIKAMGSGLTYPLKNISFTLVNDRIRSNKPWAKFDFITNNDGFVISVCRLHVEEHDEKVKNEEKEMNITNFIIP